MTNSIIELGYDLMISDLDYTALAYQDLISDTCLQTISSSSQNVF